MSENLTLGAPLRSTLPLASPLGARLDREARVTSALVLVAPLDTVADDNPPPVLSPDYGQLLAAGVI